MKSFLHFISSTSTHLRYKISESVKICTYLSCLLSVTSLSDQRGNKENHRTLLLARREYRTENTNDSEINTNKKNFSIMA